MKGFTLIELLVVVTIIGILAGIALPQYNRAVEKARATEAVVVIKALQDAMQRHMQEFPDEEPTNKTQISDVKLSNGSWVGTAGSEACFITDHFSYNIGGDGEIAVRRADGLEGCTGAAEDLKYTVTAPKIQGESDVECSSAQGTEYNYVCALFTL